MTFLASLGGLLGVVIVGALVSEHVCALLESAAKAHRYGLRAYRDVVSRVWGQGVE